MRSPNEEQKIGVEHNGNFLLQAGAGSGKTFVLIEHVVYKVKNFIYENKKMAEKDFEEALKRYLSSVVIMTFTKKAVREIIERIKETFELKSKSEDELQKKWVMAKDNIQFLTVSTIHGFCFKIISRPYFTLIPVNIDILNEISFQRKIENLFNDWFLSIEKKGINFSSNIYNSILVNSESIIKSLCSVYGSPELRLLWEKDNDLKLSKKDFKDYFKELLHACEIEDVFECDFNLGAYNNFSKKKWYSFLSDYEKIKSKGYPSDLNDLDEILNFLNENKGVRSPDKKLDLKFVNEKIANIRTLRKLIVEHYESYSSFFKTKKNGSFYEWKEILNDIFSYINKNYHRYRGYSYADMEYYCFKGLKTNDFIKNKVREEFDYFIFDEFQDTSRIQFDILKEILNNNFKNLFCVGDIKQAIYGFRGGELEVFKECESTVKNNYKLLNNYRSDSNIIYFNNSLFSYIFSQKFGEVRKWENQKSPFIKSEGILGKIKTSIQTTDTDNRKLSSYEMDYFESLVIFDKIIELKNSEDDICVLYRKLGPSSFLIELLLKENIGFTSQVKIPYQEDPLFGIFQLLIESYLERKTLVRDGGRLETYKNYCQIILDCYLKYLEIDYELVIDNIFSKFFNSVRDYGVFEAFKRSIFQMKLTGFSSEKFKIIEEICLSSNDNCHLIWKELTRHGDRKQNFEFKNGQNPERITLMTTHSSKGLEFCSVILAGIHTNGRNVSDGSFIGKLPGSYKWKEDSMQKKPFKSPYFILENYLQKKRNLEEDKRLFYVACTRAKKNLFWADLEFKGNGLFNNEKSWINYLRKWEENLITKKTDQKFNLSTYYRKLDRNEGDFSKSEIPPFYQLNPLGLKGRVPIGKRDGNSDVSLGVLSEISVTKLSSIVSCPRKYYLDNICKFGDEELEIIKYLEDIKGLSENIFFDEEGDNSNLPVKKSSKERGIDIHSKIEKYFQLSRTEKERLLEKFPSISYAIKNISSYQDDYNLIFEHPIKFSLFNFMVSGQPDLIMFPKVEGKKFRIIDFKTGERNVKNEEVYFFQLFNYGYASFNLGFLDEGSTITLSLLYVDSEKVVEKEISYSNIVDQLSIYFKKISNLHEVNLEHCPICQYKNICQSKVAQIN